MADSIRMLTTIAQLKTQSANESALDAAAKQRDLIDKQRDLRDAAGAFDELEDTADTLATLQFELTRQAAAYDRTTTTASQYYKDAGDIDWGDYFG
ncbi:MAG: hypothetical protein AAFR52_07650 [Pseudomonadota bacterium]